MPVELSVDVKLNLTLPSSAQVQAELRAAANRAADAVLARAKANLSGRFLKVRSGQGVASVRKKVTSNLQGATATVGSPLFYLRILHTGFPAQTLTTRKKGFVFFRGGHAIRVKSIHHPGVSARPWLQTAVEESTDDILLAFNEAALNIGRFLTGAGNARAA